MFSSDKNIALLRQLGDEVKHYVEVRLGIVKLDFVSKMTVLLSALIVGAILFMLLTIVILFLSYTAALALAPVVGGMATACGLIALAYLLLAFLVWVNRKRWIVNPMADFLGKLFLDPPASDNAK